jgi:MFS family permease
MAAAGLLLAVIAGCCAFVMGYAANQGGTCGVMAMREIVEERRVHLFVGFLIATAASGLLYLPLTWATHEQAHLVGGVAVGVALLAGATLLGIGAFVNGACLLGSLWRLGNGELRLLALPGGLATGYLAALHLAPRLLPHARANPFATPHLGALVFVAAFAPMLAASWLWLRGREAHQPPRWRLSVAMLVLGVAGALLYVLQPGWTYADAVRRGVAPPMVMMLAGWGGLIAAALTVAGALASAIRAGSFALVVPTASAVARTLAGGAMMAAGASLIPGGNDALLLAAIPAGTLSGLAAYMMMNAVVLGLTWIGHRAAARA